jgi:hypothetical protein
MFWGANRCNGKLLLGEDMEGVVETYVALVVGGDVIV